MAFSPVNNSAVIVNTASMTPSFAFGFTATSGRLLTLGWTVDKSSGAITKPLNWDGVLVSDNSQVSAALAYKVSTGGETTASPTMTNNQETRGQVVEWTFTGTNTLDDWTSNYESGSVNSVPTGDLTGLQTAADALALSIFGNDSGTGEQLSSYEVGTGLGFDFDSDGNNGPGFASAYELNPGATADNTLNLISGGDQMVGLIAVFYEGAAASGRIMSSLAGSGGLAGHGGIAGPGGGLAGHSAFRKHGDLLVPDKRIIVPAYGLKRAA